MAQVNQRLWKIPGQRTKPKAWGFTVQINGKRVKHYRAEWTREDAQAELAKKLLDIAPAKPEGGGITFGEAAERYLAAKSRKRSLREDTRILKHLTSVFGKDTPLADVTASRISAYKADRLANLSERTKRQLTAASINRPLALLRHLLRIAHTEWEELQAVPTIRLEREPQGRIRWLEADEEPRLLDACRASRTKHLASLVTVAHETGLRKGELLGLTWDRVDLSRGVIRLEITKSGRRREVPMRQVVYDILVALPGPREGRVWPSGDIRKAFENAVAEAKLDGLHFHDLRHSFASWFVMRGGSIQALQTILGHQDIKMTLRYAHLAPEHLRNEMAKTEQSRSALVPTADRAQGPAQAASRCGQAPRRAPLHPAKHFIPLYTTAVVSEHRESPHLCCTNAKLFRALRY